MATSATPSFPGRACRGSGGRASIWGNPYTSSHGSLEEVILLLIHQSYSFLQSLPFQRLRLYSLHLASSPLLLSSLHLLGGKEVGCWCKPAPCHGDILVREFQARVGEAKVHRVEEGEVKLPTEEETAKEEEGEEKVNEGGD